MVIRRLLPAVGGEIRRYVSAERHTLRFDGR